jgi:hypothetical protein
VRTVFFGVGASMRNETAEQPSGKSAAPPLCGSDPTIPPRRFCENSRERAEWSPESPIDQPGVRIRLGHIKGFDAALAGSLGANSP